MNINKANGSILVFLFVLILGNLDAFAEKTGIFINPAKVLGPVNRKVFGNNFLGYGPAPHETPDKEHYACSDYGAGIWDPMLKRSVEDVVDLARNSGTTVARFPGGDGALYYDWKGSVGKDRAHFRYGLDEFLKTCEEIGAQPVITVSYFTGDEFNAAELVEYLNAPSDSRHPWAMMRAENGRPEPYRVKYFEIGNEIWHGDLGKVKKVLPQDYARRYLKYYAAMKAADPSIKIGVVLHTDEWDKEVMGIIKDKADFGIIHIYPHPDVGDEQIKEMDPGDIFQETLGPSLLKKESYLLKALKITQQASNKNIPLAITEYNGGFWQDEPLPYRHCLGTALLNAELLRVFMKPKNNILMADYWNFVNEYWGMIANGFEQDKDDLHNPYYKRPNYYVFQLYHEHFGDTLIDVKANGPYLSVNASKGKDGKKLYLMVVNKNMTGNVAASIQFKGYKAAKARVWVLNGPSVEATNEMNHSEVGVKQADINLGDRQDGFDFVFPPHSLTAIEIGKEP